MDQSTTLLELFLLVHTESHIPILSFSRLLLLLFLVHVKSSILWTSSIAERQGTLTCLPLVARCIVIVLGRACWELHGTVVLLEGLRDVALFFKEVPLDLHFWLDDLLSVPLIDS